MNMKLKQFKNVLAFNDAFMRTLKMLPPGYVNEQSQATIYYNAIDNDILQNKIKNSLADNSKNLTLEKMQDIVVLNKDIYNRSQSSNYASRAINTTRHNPDKRYAPPPPSAPPYSSKSNNQRCYICNSMNHLAKSCPQNRYNNRNKSPGERSENRNFSRSPNRSSNRSAYRYSNSKSPNRYDNRSNNNSYRVKFNQTPPPQYKSSGYKSIIKKDNYRRNSNLIQSSNDNDQYESDFDERQYDRYENTKNENNKNNFQNNENKYYENNNQNNSHQTKKHYNVMCNSSKLLNFNSLILNNTFAKTIIDSGSEISIINIKIAKHFNMKVKPTDLRLKVANNNESVALGETDYIPVRVGNKVVNIKFFIVKHDEVEVLLGTDWLDISGAILNHRDKIMSFKDGEVIHANSNPACITQSYNNKSVNGRHLEPIPPNFNSSDDEEEEEDDQYFDTIEQHEEIEIFVENDEFSKFSDDEKIEWEEKLKPAIAERCATNLKSNGLFTGLYMTLVLLAHNIFNIIPFRRSEAENQELEEQVQEMFKAGVIEPSDSPYNNPVFLVAKKATKIAKNLINSVSDNIDDLKFLTKKSTRFISENVKKAKKRLVMDFRTLNSSLTNIVYPIPRVDEILDKLSGYEYFSVCDFKSGFWQCPLDEQSRKYTAFSTRSGHWQYKVCPQGVKTGPAWFSMCVAQALRSQNHCSLNYFDDVVIFSHTRKQHFKDILSVMKALNKAGFKITASKSSWFKREIKLLGYIVSGKTVKIDPDKIKTISSRPEPSNAKDVQKCLGLFNFFRRFIKDFAERSKPLYNLIKQDVEWNWNDECKAAYKYFVVCITSEPAMRQPVIGKPFIVYSDGSKHAIGGVLAQIIDGVEYIIEYASRLLKGAELNYGISDIECLAVVFLIKKWHHFLYGVHFDLYTDHKALLTLMQIKNYQGRLGRQALYLQMYEFTIKFIPGEDNHAADFASRPIQYIRTNIFKC